MKSNKPLFFIPLASFFAIFKVFIILLMILMFITTIDEADGLENGMYPQKSTTFLTLSNFIEDKALIDDLSKAFDLAQAHTGIDPLLLIAIAITESNLDIHAKSPVGYKGIMQIPIETITPQVNILIGAQIFKDKLNKTKDIRKAIALYKGYGLTRKGIEKADAVIKLYHALQSSG